MDKTLGSSPQHNNQGLNINIIFLIILQNEEVWQVNIYALNMLFTAVLWLAQMDEMIAGIREVFVSNLENLTWMDDETRKAATEKVSISKKSLRFLVRLWLQYNNHFIFKLQGCVFYFLQAQAIRERIGFSENIMNSTYLDEEYKDVSCDLF